MAYLSSLEEAKTFWANRKTYLVFHDPDLPEKIVNYDNDLQNRIEREEHEKHCHISQRTFLPTPQTVAGTVQRIKNLRNVYVHSRGTLYLCKRHTVVSSITNSR